MIIYKHKETKEVYSKWELEKEFDDYLDATYNVVSMVGYVCIPFSIALKSTNPAKYRQAFLNFLDDYEGVPEG